MFPTDFQHCWTLENVVFVIVSNLIRYDVFYWIEINLLERLQFLFFVNVGWFNLRKFSIIDIVITILEHVYSYV